ncbi:MAG TPA: DMT family transporter [Aliidongia sp.]|nr:DMT family transporter [Aliidongia sp.]
MSSAVRTGPPPAVAGQLLDEPIRGILVLLVAIVTFSCSDTLSKYLARGLPVTEIIWLRYTTYLLLMAVPVLRGGFGALRSARPRLQLLRGVAMLGSSLFFISGLRLLPIADATAISFVSPMFITALSIPVLHEQVGTRRWLAIGVGLLGVIIIVRPGTSSFQPAAILPVLSAASWACAIVITRKMSGADGIVTTLAYSAVGPFVIVSLLLPFAWVTPSPGQLAFGALYGLVATLAQWLVVIAYRYAPASVLAPLTYTQLIWSATLGYVVFGAFPDHWTFAGAAVIVLSGLYTAHRERVRASERAP